MRRILAIASVLTLLVLPAICRAMDCGMGPEVAAPAHACCPHPGSHDSKQNSKHHPAAQACLYDLLEKGKAPSTIAVEGPALQPLAFELPEAPMESVSPLVAVKDGSHLYLLHRVLLI